MNLAIFYGELRKRPFPLFSNRLSQKQVDGMDGILVGFKTHGDGRAKTLAYALATTAHETGSMMVPVREGFAKTDADARHIVRRRAYGKPDGPYGHVYYGRGRVQSTWLSNYENTSKETGVDYVKFPDKRLEPVPDAEILFTGLLDGRWNGKGKGIAHYLPTEGPDDLKNARRTVNITDKWEEIGKYYKAFLAAVETAGGVKATKTPPIPKPKPTTPSKDATIKEKAHAVLADLTDLVKLLDES